MDKILNFVLSIKNVVVLNPVILLFLGVVILGFIIQNKEELKRQSLMLPYRVKFWWYGRYQGNNENHPSLFVDAKYSLLMNKEERKRYNDELTRRRDIVRWRGVKKNRQ